MWQTSFQCHLFVGAFVLCQVYDTVGSFANTTDFDVSRGYVGAVSVGGGGGAPGKGFFGGHPRWSLLLLRFVSIIVVLVVVRILGFGGGSNAMGGSG